MDVVEQQDASDVITNNEGRNMSQGTDTIIDLTQQSDDGSCSSSQSVPFIKTEDIATPHDQLFPDNDLTSLENSPGATFGAHLTPRRCPVSKLYSDGKFHAAGIKFHFNSTSIPILDTPDSGMLHVIVGWKASEVLSDLCYRYATSGTWNAKKCGFLEGKHLMRKKVYRCNGIMACPVLLQSRDDFSHSTEEEWMELQSMVQDKDNKSDFMELTTARNLYVSLTKSGRQFCSAIPLSASSTESTTPTIGSHPTRCQGKPVIRQVRATKEFFVGCTHYYVNRNVIGRHYFQSIRSFTETARNYLRDMIEANKPTSRPGEICQYIAIKKGRGQKSCASHAVDLVECGTDSAPNGRCEAKMILYEPISEGRNGMEGEHLTFALCTGRHNHPPPRQAESTERKNGMFRELAEQSPYTTAAALKLDMQDRLLNGSPSAMRNAEISKNYMYNTLGSIRKKKEKDQYSSLFDMMGSPGTNYVRDVRVVKKEVVSKGFVFLLATEEMLEMGSESTVFAGDATFKTVMEKDPSYITPNWYLYNIVAPEDITTPTVKGNVVGRALMTCLTTEAYTALWEMFITNMRRAKANFYGLNVNDISLNVPYMELEPERKRNAIEIRAVTTDFEAAEVEGIARAISDQRGGSSRTHIEHALIGCEEHFKRAYKRRATQLGEGQRKKFLEACQKLRLATSIEEGDSAYAVIDSFDQEWSEWLSRSYVRSLAAPCFSKMDQSNRMMAFDTTNIVESQNRRANLICGTGLDPVICAQKLMKLDNVSTTIASNNIGTPNLRAPRAKSRKGHTLKPSGASQACAKTSLRGKKRKASTSRAKRDVRKKEARDPEADIETDGKMGGVDRHDPSGIESVRTEISESLLWLHKELGERCCKAVEDGNEILLVALSELYGSVLECDDMNKIKYRILDMIRAEKGNKQITSEFSEVLVLISKKQTQDLTTRQKTRNANHQDTVELDEPIAGDNKMRSDDAAEGE